jgi:hypothetical protein
MFTFAGYGSGFWFAGAVCAVGLALALGGGEADHTAQKTKEGRDRLLRAQERCKGRPSISPGDHWPALEHTHQDDRLQMQFLPSGLPPINSHCLL